MTERDKIMEKIALGECQSDRGVDHCLYCTDCCDASWHKHNIYDLKEETKDLTETS